MAYSKLGLARTLTYRGISLVIVLLGVLFLTVLVLGATGVSDRILNSMLTEELRGIRQQLVTQIRDVEQLNKALESIKHQLIIAYGLDRPWYERLPNMMLKIITLDLGSAKNIQSFSGSKQISVIILERLPNTILLVTTAIVINFLIGLFVGTWVATKPGSIVDRFVSLYAAISYAIPTWWLGLINILVFAFYFRLFPYTGMFSAPPPTDPLLRFLDLLWHVSLPLLTLIIALSGSWIYITRSLTVTTAQEDFVNVARAKGLPENLVQRRYIVRVVAPSILTNVILGLAGSIGGAILTETVFGWPGMGQLYYEAIVSLDEGLILALTYVFTLVYVIARFILEVLYVIVDPRVRY
jgi:peptide/nickel transport system permease protein